MNNEKLIIGIIGGTGKMGNLFKSLFLRKGFKVLISGEKTALTNIELAKKSNIVIISVPLGVTKEVIEKIAPFVKKESLLADLSAIKEEPVKAMLKSKASVVGMHPVFGPMIKSFKNQTIVLCPARGGKWYLRLKNFLKKEGFKIIITTPREHDEMMAVIQGLTHFSAISMGYTLKNLKVDIKKSLDFISPNYKLKINAMGRILAQDPQVYVDIGIQNTFVKNIVNEYQKSSQEILDAINKKDKAKFLRIFKEAADYLGSYKYDALEESNYLIDRLMRRK